MWCSFVYDLGIHTAPDKPQTRLLTSIIYVDMYTVPLNFQAYVVYIILLHVVMKVNHMFIAKYWGNLKLMSNEDRRKAVLPYSGNLLRE